MFKKFIKIIFSLVTIAYLFMPYSYAQDEEEMDYVWLEQTVEEAKKENKLEIFSKNVVVYDRNSKTVIWGKDEMQEVPMASTTKIMTAIILLENANLNKTVEVVRDAAIVGGSTVGLKTGDKITYNDLLYSLMLCSGNDAAVQIAFGIGGNIEGFADLMNKKAEELGLKHTHFVTPHGLDKEEHYTTALELAKLADYALQIEKFAEVVNTKSYQVTINGYTKTISNTNELLGYLDGVNGVKTGFTNNAGRCLVTSVEREGFNIITVVLGADTKKIRTRDSIKLIEYTYANYELIDLSKIVEEEFESWRNINNKRIYVYKGEESIPELILKEMNYNFFPIKKGNSNRISANTSFIKFMEAPILANTKIGEIEVYVDSNAVMTVDILTKNTVKRKSVAEYIVENFQILRRIK